MSTFGKPETSKVPDQIVTHDPIITHAPLFLCDENFKLFFKYSVSALEFIDINIGIVPQDCLNHCCRKCGK